MKPHLLDLFAGEGGMTHGYRLAGFHVTAVDTNRKALERNPADLTVVADAMDVFDPDFWLLGGLGDFDAIHASPPCPRFSTATSVSGDRDAHPDYLDELRLMLELTGKPYVIENVPGAPLHEPVTVCGASLGLGIPGYELRRHRLFETNWTLFVPSCAHGWQTPRFRPLDQRRPVRGSVPVHGSSQLASVVGVHGNLNYAGEMEIRKRAMGIDWMSNYELTQAIPPAYTELIGHQLLAHLKVAA